MPFTRVYIRRLHHARASVLPSVTSVLRGHGLFVAWKLPLTAAEIAAVREREPDDTFIRKAMDSAEAAVGKTSRNNCEYYATEFLDAETPEEVVAEQRRALRHAFGDLVTDKSSGKS